MQKLENTRMCFSYFFSVTELTSNEGIHLFFLINSVVFRTNYYIRLETLSAIIKTGFMECQQKSWNLTFRPLTLGPCSRWSSTNYLPLSSCKILSLFKENNNVLVLVTIWVSSCRWPTFDSSAFKVSSHPKDEKCPDLWPLIRPPRRSLALDRGRILIPRLIWSPPKLAV